QEKMDNADKEGKPREGKKGEQGEGKQKGDGNSPVEMQQGKEGEAAEGEERGLNEIYENYKEKQFLREQLEMHLRNMSNKEYRELTEKLLRQMEDFQNDLLENGITQRSMAKVNNIQHQLLKLEDAVLEQGLKEERESRTNLQDYNNPIISKPEQFKESR